MAAFPITTITMSHEHYSAFPFNSSHKVTALKSETGDSVMMQMQYIYGIYHFTFRNSMYCFYDERSRIFAGRRYIMLINDTFMTKKPNFGFRLWVLC